MSNSIARPALVLGLLSCIGPFAIDMYLPAMPAIGTDLSATVQDMQGTITAYFVAFGLAQLVYGPWADQAGRKTPLYAGIAIFCLGTLLCMMAPSGAMLSAGRFVQGLGGAALMVVPRAIIRDMSTGNEATRLMAAMMLVFSVSPMLAPLAGSGLLLVTGWRGIFAALLVAAMFSVALLRFGQPETLPPALRQRFHAARGQAVADGSRLCRADLPWGLWHGEFLRLSGLGGLCLYRKLRAFPHRILAGLCGLYRWLGSAGRDSRRRALYLHHRAGLGQCLPWHGDPHDDGDGAGRSRRYCRTGLIAGRHLADADGGRDRGGDGTVLFRRSRTDDRGDRVLRGGGAAAVAPDTRASA